MKQVAFATLGCKTNQYETDAIMDMFYRQRYTVVDYEDFADIYVINTCTVTHVGDKKSRQLIRRAKKNNPDAIVVVMGCYAQISPDEVKAIQGVDIVIGTESRASILDHIDHYRTGKTEKPLVVVEDIMQIKTFEETPLGNSLSHTRAFIKIQEGCNQYCSYCIIPYARGQVRSRDLSNVVEEVKRLADAGYIEFVLTGIHISSYGIDLGELKLIDLLESLNTIKNVQRIRLGSIEPRVITDDFVLRLKKLDKVCPHFHLSLQSGSESVLLRMNRKYSPKEFETSVEKLRSIYLNPSITTDIIVGFPGESNFEFDETMSFVKSINFSEIHVFPFSKREGTVAAKLKDQISNDVKKERSEMLIQLAKEQQSQYEKSFIGSKATVIVEGISGHYAHGYTANYLSVKFKSSAHKIGDSVDIIVDQLENDHLIGHVL